MCGWHFWDLSYNNISLMLCLEKEAEENRIKEELEKKCLEEEERQRQFDEVADKQRAKQLEIEEKLKQQQQQSAEMKVAPDKGLYCYVLYCSYQF